MARKIGSRNGYRMTTLRNMGVIKKLFQYKTKWDNKTNPYLKAVNLNEEKNNYFIINDDNGINKYVNVELTKGKFASVSMADWELIKCYRWCAVNVGRLDGREQWYAVTDIPDITKVSGKTRLYMHTCILPYATKF